MICWRDELFSYTSRELKDANAVSSLEYTRMYSLWEEIFRCPEEV